jgi:hypothetical protein
MKVLPQEIGDVFRVVTRNVDTHFPHDIDCRGIQFSGRGAPTEYLEPVRRVVPQETFGHLAAARILSTHKQHSWLDH